MSEMTISEARSSLGEAVDTARIECEPLYLTRHGKRVTANSDEAMLEHLLETAEELADLRAAQETQERIAQGDEELIPWEDVKKDLGL
ncbi:type II toxin-antitoxin system Phd/YefM family antitoxin [Rothia sp. ZJ1223]|uniref:type II toxin-antitoxin system Phd/YefM family antitoxin n=1 Tax=Rothia sp. ZJ1223 TaxID=2811098 RepID=UPI00195A9552|nr:type II toxin-antitoxin system Phd/YefM family antitoxin [Rothia sp. ZJ1223]MBM7052004.1 type II toxin-antitoxin system Phd/YefM family antitoxin [Rothia sp. ZJ1223]